MFTCKACPLNWIKLKKKYVTTVVGVDSGFKLNYYASGKELLGQGGFKAITFPDLHFLGKDE